MSQPGSDLFGHKQTADPEGPVECLGVTFQNDGERREHFLGILREKLKDLEFRNTPGFPKGSDEDILRLSDPPYYTACPNPFLEDFVRCYGKPYDPAVPYHREPFAVDVSEGKTDALYKAHGYHTKVPHLAIVPSILHYTNPGDIVLDGFCGSGMTGVAAQWCGAAPGEVRHKLEQEWREAGLGKPEWGSRRAILGDLSPAATFIAANYNLPFDVRAFEHAAKRILKEVDGEIGWMYETVHTDGKTKNFVISADHGHQFSVRKEDDMKTDNPGGDTLDLHRRCWIGHGGSTPAGAVRVTGAELGYHTDLDFVFPTGLGVFKAGGGLSFHHGAFSLQEIVIPVISLRMATGKPAEVPGVHVRIEGCPPKVTNRTFGLKLAAGGDLLATEPLMLRVLLISGAEEVGRAGMAVGGDFDRGKSTLTLELGAEASVGMMLTNDACESLRVLVLDARTDGVLAESDELPVKLGI
jgi:hypothetical protein